MRLMLVCTTPTTVPTIMVIAATTASIGIHCVCSESSGYRNTRTKAANAAALTPVDMNAVTIVGAPSYASGVHMWKGTAEILKKKPTASRPIVRNVSVDGAPAACEDKATAICSRRVDPDSAKAKAMPYRKKALEKEPSRKYLNAPSAPVALA